jgi:hypothetical protein
MLSGNSKSQIPRSKQIPNEKISKISLAADIFWSLKFELCERKVGFAKS